MSTSLAPPCRWGMTGRIVDGCIEFVCSGCGQIAVAPEGRYAAGAACPRDRGTVVTTVYATGVVRKTIA